MREGCRPPRSCNPWGLRSLAPCPLLWEIRATMKLHSKPRDPPSSILPWGLRLPWSSEILLWEINTSNNEASQQACSVQHPSLGSSIFGSLPWFSELLLWEIHATMKLHSKPRDPPCSILPRGLRSLARCHGPRNYYCGKYMQQ